MHPGSDAECEDEIAPKMTRNLGEKDGMEIEFVQKEIDIDV